jgi:hypothetical protein
VLRREDEADAATDARRRITLIGVWRGRAVLGELSGGGRRLVMMNLRVLFGLGTMGLLMPLSCGSGSDHSTPRRASGGNAGSAGASGKGGASGKSGSGGSAGRSGATGGRAGKSGRGGSETSGGEAGDETRGSGGSLGGSSNTGGGEGGQGAASGSGGVSGSGAAASAGEGGDDGGCSAGTFPCNGECVDETKELWLFKGKDGCSVEFSTYLRVPAGAVVTAGQTSNYEAWNDVYDCDGNGSAETPSPMEVGEFLKQPFVDGTCAAFCTTGSGFHDTELTEAESLCFLPSATTLYFDVERP